MTREEIERYGEMLDDELYRNLLSIEKSGEGTYSIGDEKFFFITGRLGAIKYIKMFEEKLIEDAKEYIKNSNKAI